MKNSYQLFYHLLTHRFDQKTVNLTVFSFCRKKGEDENLPRVSDGVRIPNEAIEKLAFQWRMQEYSPLAKIPPLRPKDRQFDGLFMLSKKVRARTRLA